MSYYDAILAGIPISMVTGAAIGLTTAVPLNLSVAGGAMISFAFMYHGMFRNAPVSPVAHYQ